MYEYIFHTKLKLSLTE